jgi:hypothetical protein
VHGAGSVNFETHDLTHFCGAILPVADDQWWTSDCSCQRPEGMGGSEDTWV